MPLVLLLLVGAGLGGAGVLALQQLALPPLFEPVAAPPVPDCSNSIGIRTSVGANLTVYDIDSLEAGAVPLEGLRYWLFAPGLIDAVASGNVSDLPRGEGSFRYEDRAGSPDTLDVGDALVREAPDHRDLHLGNGAGAFGSTTPCL